MLSTPLRILFSNFIIYSIVKLSLCNFFLSNVTLFFYVLGCACVNKKKVS